MPISLLHRRKTAARSATSFLGALAIGALSACGGDARPLTAVEFTTPTPPAPVAGSCTPLVMSVGAATTIAGTNVCVSGGALGAEFALVPFNASTTASARATFDVQPTGILPVTSALAEVSAAGMLGASSAQIAATGQQTFELALRSRERTALVSRAGNARSWFASRGASGGARLNVIPKTALVGDLVSLNSNADQACSKPIMRAARIMAVGRRALVVADTLNPNGGYTQSDYASIAATFDDVVDPINTKAFGDPSDIDGNGRVVLFFTSAVNALTPKDASYYVGGFFYGRDLLPTTGTSVAGACAASNTAEMFYMLVPDPTGMINGNDFSKDFVSRATIATVAHEYEHLINASRRLYVNTGASDFEDTWLDEGLAHMAEELLFYGRSGLTERNNIDATLVRSNNTYRNAFNTDGISNFGRFGSFLSSPSTNSPYAGNDSLATRGATWAFLRYAIDQQLASQETVLNRLLNSTTTGLANLRAVFGTDLTPIFRDWSNALILDDVSGAGSQYQYRSWNMSSIFSALDKDGLYRLGAQSLATGESRSVSIAGGGAAYLRFGVAANGVGSLSWTAPAAIQTTIVRLK
ncbi:MAG: hypothetical protein H7Z40_19660 [Phycisphaerae bacterium]|nr:hypothetical protein [Gemmatimonadaceae bacterium]